MRPACERLFELGEQGVLRDAREVHLRLLEVGSSLIQRDGDDLAAAIEVAVQVFELGALAERLDRELVALLPPVVTKKGLSDTDVREGGRIRRRVGGLAGGVEIELRQAGSFVLVGDQLAPEVEMVDDFEDPLFERLRRQRGSKAVARW